MSTNKQKSLLLALVILMLNACAQKTPQVLITIADARINRAEFIDIGAAGDSPGDILTFDQPLLNKDKIKIGNNNGACVRTRVKHSFQCQWTLTLSDGSIQVAGREFDQGTSVISIVGGTGKYFGIKGEMESRKNNDGTFTQTLHFIIDK